MGGISLAEEKVGNKSGQCTFCGQGGKKICNIEKYEALKCRRCGLIWINPHPLAEDIREIYSAQYFENWYLKYRDERKAYFRKRLKEIEKIIATDSKESVAERKLLDVGCGIGLFLEIARERGWDVQGCDTSSFAARYVRDNLNIEVRGKDLAEINFVPQSFDLITMWDVIEHLTHPREYLEKISSLLKDKGRLVIKTPDHPSRLFRLLGMVPSNSARGFLYIPSQIYHFSPAVLSNVLKKVGFKAIKVKMVKEVLSGSRTSSGYKELLISLFNIFLRIIGTGESFIVYAEK